MKRSFLSLILLCACVFLTRAAVTDTIVVPSANIPVAAKVTVITPDAAAADATARFPAVYMLNGYGGDNTSWTKIRPDLGALADRYGMIFILPSGLDSWYWDSPVKPELKMETYMTSDLVPYIDSHYPTDARPSRRAITGLSMGGHGAFWLGLRHPDIWRNIGSMSGGLDIKPFPNRWTMKDKLGTIEQYPDNWVNYSAISLVPSVQPGTFNITFDCGVDDFFAEVNRDMHRALLKAGIAHDYTERPGAHTMQYWGNSILYHLLFFNEAFSK